MALCSGANGSSNPGGFIEPGSTGRYLNISCPTSFGMSIKTGPGLPDEAIRKACATTFAISDGSLTTHECLTIGSVIPKISVS